MHCSPCFPPLSFLYFVIIPLYKRRSGYTILN
nr:MAG TPA: hypothetical protein [Caudoviricetes sp.]